MPLEQYEYIRIPINISVSGNIPNMHVIKFATARVLRIVREDRWKTFTSAYTIFKNGLVIIVLYTYLLHGLPTYLLAPGGVCRSIPHPPPGKGEEYVLKGWITNREVIKSVPDFVKVVITGAIACFSRE